MTASHPSARQRLITAALELFVRQGVAETTTRQIADFAAVNEVTLFRQFGNKQGLLLAVLEEAQVLTDWRQSLGQLEASSLDQALKSYASACLESLERVPKFLSSLLGEAGQYPVQNRQALGKYLAQANHHVAQTLEIIVQRDQLQAGLPIEKVASLLSSLVLGYAVIELASETHNLWENRDDFLDTLVKVFVQGAVYEPHSSGEQTIQANHQLTGAPKVADLPAPLVQAILQQAKKCGLRDYGLAYTLFATGLSPGEIVALERTHQICNSQQHLLQVAQAKDRQVPVNRWIMGKRYGTYNRNPLTRWLKSRKDGLSAMFLNDAGNPISHSEINQCWLAWTEGLLTPEGQSPTIAQVQQTWCVEMLAKGVSLSTLSLLTGQELVSLEPYAIRAKQKAALEQAMQLDQPVSSSKKGVLSNQTSIE